MIKLSSNVKLKCGKEMEWVSLKKKKVSVICLVLLMLFVTGCTKKSESTISTTTTKEVTQSTKLKPSDSTDATKTTVETSSNQSSVSSETQTTTNTESMQSNTDQTTQVITRHYTEAEKQAITTAFSDWAENRAAIGGMALNDAYFDHGASGLGDWYAVTENGQRLLVQRQDPNINISPDAYIGEALGGVVFYTSKNGAVGYSNEINDPNNQPSTAAGFSKVANLEKPIVKYLLGSNGVVYEFQSSGAFSDGFYETSDQGDFNYWPTTQVPFKVSEDAAAQETLQTILAQYNQ